VWIAVRRAALLLLLLVAGCGGGGSAGTPDETVRVLLDFTPNGVHAGLYLARQRGYDTTEGAQIRIRRPGASTDALKLLQAGRADAAILDIHDLGLARERRRDLVGVMAIVQRPLAAVLAQPSIGSPRELEGRRAGVTGLPSDSAVLDTVVRGDGGDPGRVREVTIGFEAERALLARRVDAATAFWNVEGVAVKARRPRIREFRVDAFGAPAYPELVLVVTRATLQERRATVEALVRALQRGYREAQVDPESAVVAMLERERGLDREALAAQVDAVAPAWSAGARFIGQLRRDALEAWAAWDAETGILRRAPDVEAAFAFDVAQPPPAP
jgi:ABC-type nitrate/sulfonate/bicarbonate transport system substrate-binding protein